MQVPEQKQPGTSLAPPSEKAQVLTSLSKLILFHICAAPYPRQTRGIIPEQIVLTRTAPTLKKPTLLACNIWP